MTTWKCDTVQLWRIVTNLRAEFNDDRLWNGEALVLWKHDNNDPNKNIGDPFPGPELKKTLKTRFLSKKVDANEELNPGQIEPRVLYRHRQTAAAMKI